MTKQISTMTLHSGEWSDHDSLDAARVWTDRYVDFAGDDAECVILIISENNIVVDAYDIDETYEQLAQFIGKNVDELG